MDDATLYCNYKSGEYSSRFQMMVESFDRQTVQQLRGVFSGGADQLKVSCSCKIKQLVEDVEINLGIQMDSSIKCDQVVQASCEHMHNYAMRGQLQHGSGQNSNLSIETAKKTFLNSSQLQLCKHNLCNESANVPKFDNFRLQADFEMNYLLNRYSPGWYTLNRKLYMGYFAYCNIFFRITILFSCAISHNSILD